jgi:integrase
VRSSGAVTVDQVSMKCNNKYKEQKEKDEGRREDRQRQGPTLERIQRGDIYPVTEGCNSDYTRRSYKTSFNHFQKHIKVYDLQVLADFGPDALEQLIIMYVIHARDEKKLSRASIEAELHAIYHFCDLNNLLVNKKRVRYFLPPERSAHEDRLYTEEEMQHILGACRNKREKVIILLMVAAGVRIGAISKLKVKDLEPRNINGYNTFKITVDADDRNAKYWTTCTNELYVAVTEYLQQREREGEGSPILGTSPLIREHRDPNKMLRMVKPRHVSDIAIRYAVREIIKRSGAYIKDPKKQKLMMSHSFRKNFKTVCESSPMKSLYVEMLMGHKDALVKSYLRAKETEVISDFITHAADALTIDPTQRLKQENHDLKFTQAQQLARQSQEIEQLRAALKEWEPVKAEMIKTWKYIESLKERYKD